VVSEIEQAKIRNRTMTPEELRKLFGRCVLRSIDPSQEAEFRRYMKGKVVTPDNIYELAQYVDEHFKKRKSMFRFIDVPRKCTVNLIETEVHKHTKVAPCHLVVIDYLNIMEPTHKVGTTAIDHGMLARELKELARDLRLTVLTAAQMLIRKGDQISAADMKYSRMIVENADYVLSWKQTEEDKYLDRIRLRLIKHRHTGDMTFVMRQDFTKMKISNFYDTTTS
jgi:replicative DNA helicase